MSTSKIIIVPEFGVEEVACCMNGLVEHIVPPPINYFPNGVKFETIPVIVTSNSLFRPIHGLIKGPHWGLFPIYQAENSNQGLHHLQLKSRKQLLIRE